MELEPRRQNKKSPAEAGLKGMESRIETINQATFSN